MKKHTMITKICTTAMILGTMSIMLTACETPKQDAPEAATTEPIAPSTEPVVGEEEEPAPVVDDAQMIEKIEQLKETCAKLDEPPHDACENFHALVAAGDAGARADLDTVLGGSRVADPNMVYLEEEVAAMLVEKYGKAE